MKESRKLLGRYLQALRSAVDRKLDRRVRGERPQEAWTAHFWQSQRSA
jgi:hypothetical protein